MRTVTTPERSSAELDVVVVTSTFPRHGRDGTGRFLLDLLEPLPFRVRVLCPDDDAADPGPWTHLDVRRFPQSGLFYGAGAVANRRSGRAGAWRTTRSLLSMAAATLREARGADVIWSHWAVPAGVIGALARRLHGTRHVLSLHSGDVWWLEQQRFGRQLARWIARHSDAVCGVSADVVARFERLSGVRGRVLGCGVQDPGVAGVGAATPRPRVGTLSRLAPGKGVVELLARAQDLPAALHVAGDGPLAGPVRRACATHDASFHGPLVGADKQAYLASLDVFLAPYSGTPWGQSEGLPVAVLEALAAGLPVVAFAHAAPPEVLRHDENAVLVPTGDTRALVAATRALLDDPARRARLAAAARRSARPWLMPTVGAAWTGLLADLASSAHDGRQSTQALDCSRTGVRTGPRSGSRSRPGSGTRPGARAGTTRSG